MIASRQPKRASGLEPARSLAGIESQTKSTDANLTNAPDGTTRTLTVRECPPEIDTATALRRRASGLLVLVVLRCALDRRYPALAPLHPDLGFGLQLEGGVIQTSDPNLDERVVGVGCVKEPRPTAGAEAATGIA